MHAGNVSAVGLEDGLFDPEHDCPPYDGERRYYVVCSPPRTGSTLLCRMMAASGVMGAPGEFFHPTNGWPIMAKRLGLWRDGKVDLDAYVDGLKAIRTTPNGVFGVKINYWMIGRMIENKVISTHFPGAVFVYLTRRDLVAQGVSFEIARQTGKWNSESHPEGEGTIPGPADSPLTGQPVLDEPVYDEGRIMEAINFVAHGQVNWQAFFALNDIDPYHVDYERLIENTDEACADICARVGVATDYGFSLDQTPLELQASELNAEWISRIKASTGY